MILVAFSLLLTNPAPAFDQVKPLPIQACKTHNPYGLAETKRQVTYICRSGYLSAFDVQAKIPNYVTYTLIPKNAIGCALRSNSFTTDASTPYSAKPSDYYGTGYDKGHAAPDGDFTYDPEIGQQSFFMTNMYPQHPSLNRGIWKLLETTIRAWAYQNNHTFTIYVGALYNDKDKKIGNGVVVPTAFYKIIVNHQTNETAAWMFPHTEPYKNLGKDLKVYRIPVNELVKTANINFKFPQNASELLPGKEWQANYGKLTSDKRQQCK